MNEFEKHNKALGNVRKPNTITVIQGKQYLVKEKADCKECAFREADCIKIYTGECRKAYREDKKDVIFAKLERNKEGRYEVSKT